MAVDPASRNRLNAVKLGALARSGWGAESRPAQPFPAGAALVGDGGEGWVLLDEGHERRLGGALTWALKAGVSRLHVLVDDPAPAGLLARRAAYMARPAVDAWVVEGTSVTPAAPAPMPRPLPAPDAPELRELLVDAGLELVDEDGVVVGELLGLEVARIEHHPEGAGGARLSVGVGRYDREVTELLHAELSPARQVRRAVDIVARYRRPGAPPHPMNRLVPERWLRSVLVRRPELAGVASLRPVVSAVPRANLRETVPATAVGTDAGGGPVVVVCSVGVDLELVPTAADDRAFHHGHDHGGQARLLLVLPERDVLPVISELAAGLDPPAEVVGLPGDWRALG